SGPAPPAGGGPRSSAARPAATRLATRLAPRLAAPPGAVAQGETVEVADQRRSWLVSLIAAELTTRTSYQMGKSPLLPVFATLLGAGAEVLGLIVAVSTVTGLLASPIAGALSDRYGRRRFLLAGTVLFAPCRPWPTRSCTTRRS
ncbi:MAG TPA: MFS transporter, partial [Chloroflexota bacterium]|nr:MFS transporter [Chloroflexota bacterium]